MKVHAFIFISFVIFSFGHINRIYAQKFQNNIDTTINFILYFKIDGATLDSVYMGNSESLKKLDDLIRNKLTISNIDSITIEASSSPDGNESYNMLLSKKRAEYVKAFITDKYPVIKSELIRTHHIGEDWESFKRLIEMDNNIPHREKILKIIHSDRDPGAKEWLIKTLEGGIPWRYIKKNFLPLLRTGAVCVIYYKKQTIPVEKKEEPKEKEMANPPQEPKPVATPPSPVIITKPLFAIKTNLLYDVLSAANLEIEIPLGNRWSVAAEGIFPWWKSSRADWTMQLLAGYATVKYWLGNRDTKEILTGWNIGLYGGGGKYDLQIFHEKGEQGNFFDAGLQAAYAHRIGKHLRMEYSLGVGYLQRDCKKYDKAYNTMYGDIKVFKFPWEVKRREWFGPTSAKISLVWLLNKKTVKKEGGIK